MAAEGWLIAGISTLVLGFWAVLFWLIRLGKREHARVAAEFAPIYALPLITAREDAWRLLLGEDSPFETSESPVVAGSLDPALPTGVRDLFSRFERIGVGESLIDRTVVGPSSDHPGFVRIGSDVEFAEILVRPGEEPVFTLDLTPTPDISQECVPSAYHWVLYVAHEHRRVCVKRRGVEQGDGADERRTR